MGMSVGHHPNTTSKVAAELRGPTGPDAPDAPLEAVVDWFRAREDVARVLATAIRQAIDDVLDGPRTGRWSRHQLEKSEMNYLGTRIELLARAALGLERVGALDTMIVGTPVHLNWSFQSNWGIPSNAVGQVCLLMGGHGESEFGAGIVRAESHLLDPRKDDEGAHAIAAAGRARTRWLLERAPLPGNYVAELPEDVRQFVMTGSTGQERIRRLFNSVVERPVPRLAVATVARQLDPMRRVRADRARRLGDVRVFGGRYRNDVLARLGYPPLKDDEYMSVPLVRLPTELR